jgi:hypothetical protein
LLDKAPAFCDAPPQESVRMYNRSIITRLRAVARAAFWRLLIRLAPAGDRAALRVLQLQLGVRTRLAAGAVDATARELALEALAADSPQEIWLSLPGSTCVRTDKAGLLLRHRVVRLHQTTSHMLQFPGGGFFAFMVDDQKTMMEVHARKLRLATGPGLLEVLPAHGRMA